MTKWKMFNKSKPKEETIQAPENKPLVEHRETLYTSSPSSKKAGTTTSSDQRIWRDVKTIEENIDTIHVSKSGESSPDLDKTVDRLIAKKKK